MLSRACLEGSARSARRTGPVLRRGRRPGSFRRRLLSVALVVVGVLALAPAGAWAQTLDQQQESFAAGGEIINGPDRGAGGGDSAAQTFTAGLSGALDRVDLALAQASTPSVGPLTVEIRDAVGGAPGTTVLASTEVPQPNVPTGGSQALAFVEVPFDSPTTVAAGSQYAIVAYTGGSDFYQWGRSGADLYAGGSRFDSFESPPAIWLPVPANDHAFRTYVAPADTTAPTSTAAAEPVAQGQPPITVTATATFKTTAGATVGTVGPVSCWNSRGVRVNLDATDNTGGSGVATLAYAATGAQPIPSTTVPAAALPATVTITAPGVTRLTYQATDQAGNQEQPNSETVLVGPSNRPPFACALPTPESFTIPAHGSVTVTGTATIGQGTFPFSTTIRY
jgi:hypothetical protein